MKHWERVAWMIALIGGVHAAYTTWMSGWVYMNGRRDVILGIGSTSGPLKRDLAQLVFYNDWATCALGFFCYVVIAFGILWLLVAKYKPVQEALLNPFGMEIELAGMEKRRRVLGFSVGLGVAAAIVLLAATIWKDATDTLRLIEKYCQAPTTIPASTIMTPPRPQPNPVSQPGATNGPTNQPQPKS